MLIVGDETVVNIAVAGEVEVGVVEEVVVKLLPRVLNESDGNIA